MKGMHPHPPALHGLKRCPTPNNPLRPTASGCTPLGILMYVNNHAHSRLAVIEVMER